MAWQNRFRTALDVDSGDRAGLLDISVHATPDVDCFTQFSPARDGRLYSSSCTLQYSIKVTAICLLVTVRDCFWLPVLAGAEIRGEEGNRAGIEVGCQDSH